MAKKIRLDFSKVEERSGWNSRQMPEGLYEGKIVSVSDQDAADGTGMQTYAIKPTQKKYATRLFPYYCKLQQNQLWKLRDLFVAAGETIPKRAVNLDPAAVVGATIAIEIGDGSGQYSDRSEIVNVYPMSTLDGLDDDEDDEYDEDEAEEAEDEEYDESDEEDEDYDDEEEDDEDDSDEEYEDDDEDLDEDEDDEEDEEDDEDEDDEEEEEPAPKRARKPVAKKSAAKPAPKRATAKPAAKAPAKRVVKRKR